MAAMEKKREKAEATHLEEQNELMKELQTAQQKHLAEV